MTDSAISKRWAALALATAVLTSGPAAAQIARNSDAPVDMTADELEVVNAQCLAIWRGSAEALQDNSRLRADVLKIFNKPGTKPKADATDRNCGALDRMEAQGNVYYVTPAQRVRSDAAVYDAISDTITMTGDVVAAQGKNVLRGQKLVIKVSTGEAQMQTSSKGRGAPNRVRGVYYPKDKDAAPAAKK